MITSTASWEPENTLQQPADVNLNPSWTLPADVGTSPLLTEAGSSSPPTLMGTSPVPTSIDSGPLPTVMGTGTLPTEVSTVSLSTDTTSAKALQLLQPQSSMFMTIMDSAFQKRRQYARKQSMLRVKELRTQAKIRQNQFEMLLLNQRLLELN